MGPSCPANSIWKGLYQHSSTEGMGISWKVWGEGWETQSKTALTLVTPLLRRVTFLNLIEITEWQGLIWQWTKSCYGSIMSAFGVQLLDPSHTMSLWNSWCWLIRTAQPTCFISPFVCIHTNPATLLSQMGYSFTDDP